jgi:hypothetical protein
MTDATDHPDLPRLENPETGVRHAVADGWAAVQQGRPEILTTICGVQNEDFELSLDGTWDEYDDGSLCRRCTQRVSAGLQALVDEIRR